MGQSQHQNLRIDDDNLKDWSVAEVSNNEDGGAYGAPIVKTFPQHSDRCVMTNRGKFNQETSDHDGCRQAVDRSTANQWIRDVGSDHKMVQQGVDQNRICSTWLSNGAEWAQKQSEEVNAAFIDTERDEDRFKAHRLNRELVNWMTGVFIGKAWSHAKPVDPSQGLEAWRQV